MDVPHADAARRNFHPSPLFALAACLAFGIIAGKFIPLGRASYVSAAAACAAIAVISLGKNKSALSAFALCLSFVIAGGALVGADRVGAKRLRRQLDEKATATMTTSAPAEVTGVLARSPEIAFDGFYLTLRVEQIGDGDGERRAEGVVWIFAAAHDASAREIYNALDLKRGVRLRALVALDRSNRYRNPGVAQLTDFLEQKNYDAVGSIKSPLLVERLGEDDVFPPLLWLDAWREELLRRTRALFSPRAAGVLAASLLGDQYLLTRESAERFRAGGTFHMLVISGLHISVVGGLTLSAVRRATRRRWCQCAASLAFLWSYALMVGADVSVVRAALMFSFVALAPVIWRRADSVNATGAAALALLARNPGDLFDPGFQLSFLAVLSIVAAGWPLLRHLRAIGAWRLTAATPHPPRVARWLLVASEALYWSESDWRRETSGRIFRYRLRKSAWAARLERGRLQRPLRYVAAALIVSICVQIALLPLLVVYFHRVSLAALVLNFWVGAWMAALSVAAVAALVVAQVNVGWARPLLWLAESCNSLMEGGTDSFTAWHLDSWRVPEYTGWSASIYAFYYLPPVIAAVGVTRWRPLSLAPPAIETGRGGMRVFRRACSALLVLSAIIVFHPMSERANAENRLEVNFLDVGQGDAALIVLPDATTILVDGGGRPRTTATAGGANGKEDSNSTPDFEPDRRSIGEAVVSEYLWWRGLDRVDYLIATHADADHIQGLVDVARNFRVRAALVARTPPDNDEFARFAAALRRERVPLQVIGAGDTLRAGGGEKGSVVEIKVLWPPLVADENTLATASSGNDDSLVLSLSYGARRVLLTGDAERRAEARLLGADLRGDVVKVAHHGSRTSSGESFVKAVGAALAVVSVGRDSPYGHPSPEVVARWEARGARVITTGRAGTITVDTDGEDLRVTTFVNAVPDGADATR